MTMDSWRGTWVHRLWRGWLMRGVGARVFICIAIAKKDVTFFRVDANRTKHGWPTMLFNGSYSIATAWTKVRLSIKKK